ncbi:TPA: 50S ribosomal protein L29 [Candidatus Micrarchaeota archaeon]|nr:50S ribosomal protein L29 [Candidatus Micrarchaeota archaeon]HIH29831.1 50S ribosomal protein L29 [Candidatus Micrarchaeota archaeon]
MAIMKSSKARELSESELSAKLFEYQKELNSERGLLASGGRTSNPGKLRELRKTVARIMTIMHERKLGIERGKKKPADQEPKK